MRRIANIDQHRAHGQCRHRTDPKFDAIARVVDVLIHFQWRWEPMGVLGELDDAEIGDGQVLSAPVVPVRALIIVGRRRHQVSEQSADVRAGLRALLPAGLDHGAHLGRQLPHVVLVPQQVLREGRRDPVAELVGGHRGSEVSEADVLHGGDG